MVYGRLNKRLFAQLLSRMDAHLANWKTQMISFAGHITLATFVLMALPNHVMQLCIFLDQFAMNMIKILGIFSGEIKERIKRFI